MVYYCSQLLYIDWPRTQGDAIVAREAVAGSRRADEGACRHWLADAERRGYRAQAHAKRPGGESAQALPE